MTSPTDMLDVPQVAAELRLSEWRVRELLRDGRFKNATRPGRSWLVPRADVDLYLARGKRVTRG